MAFGAGGNLGEYQILELLGKGGMGEVYRGRDTKLCRDVAVKTLPAEFARDAERVKRFQREARILAALNHPNIAAIYGLEESDGHSFLVLELVEGESLAQRIERAGAIPVRDSLRIAVQVAEALDAAHSRGVIHRDLKPGNIMITPRGHIKLLDFGLATYAGLGVAEETRTLDPVTRAGAFVGTPQYMAPEILRGSPGDARSDLWAFGIVLYTMLHGDVPFRGMTIAEVCSAILQYPVPPLGSTVPGPLQRIVEKALNKNPAERYQSASEMRDTLEKLSTETAAAPPSRRRWVWAAGSLALAAGTALWTYGRRSAPRTLLSTGAPAASNQEANELFELAMQFMRRQNDLPRGQRALERALAIEPQFPEALRYHAFGYLIQILNGYTNDISLLYKAEQELKRASQLDPTLISLPSAFTALFLMEGRRDLVPANELDRVIAQNPTNADARLWRAILHWLGGENGKARRDLTEMLKTDPLLGAGRMFLGESLRMDNDLAGAIREEKKVLELAPENISAICWLSLAMMNSGLLEQTRDLLQAKRASFEANYLWRSLWALLLAVEGRREQALAAMDEGNLRFLGAAFVVTLIAAEFFAVVGDSAKAMEWLDKAVRNGDERVEWFKRDPWLASIRNRPGFQTILESVESRRRQRTLSRQ